MQQKTTRYVSVITSLFFIPALLSAVFLLSPATQAAPVGPEGGSNSGSAGGGSPAPSGSLNGGAPYAPGAGSLLPGVFGTALQLANAANSANNANNSEAPADDSSSGGSTDTGGSTEAPGGGDASGTSTPAGDGEEAGEQTQPKPTPGMQAEQTNPKGPPCTVLCVKDIWSLIKLVMKVLVAGVGITAAGGIIYAAVLYSSAADKADQVKKAKDVILQVVIGVLLFGFMFAILNFLVPGGIFE